MDPRSLSCSIAQVDHIYPAEKFLVSKQPTFERWLSSGAQGHGAPRLVKGGDCAWSKSRPPQLQETVMLPWPTLTPSVVVAPAGAKSDPPPPPFPFAGLAATPCQQNVPPLAPSTAPEEATTSTSTAILGHVTSVAARSSLSAATGGACQS